MKTVSFEKAKALMENEFHQPEIRNTQMWYDSTGILYHIREVEIIEMGVGKIIRKALFDPWDENLGWWAFDRSSRMETIGDIYFAATIDDLLRELPTEYREKWVNEIPSDVDEYAQEWIRLRERYK